MFESVRCGVLLSFVTCLIGSSNLLAQQAVESQLLSVTLYPDQARLVREIQIPPSDQVQRFRVIGLPQSLQVQSVMPQADAKTTVHSVQVRSESASEVSASKDPEHSLERSKLILERTRSKQEQKIIEQDLETIEDLVDFSAARIRNDLLHMALNVKAVTGVADFTMQRRRALAEKLFAQKESIQSLNAQISALQHQPKTFKPSYQALITVDSPGGGWVRLSYHVNNVGWSPRYSIHSTDGKEFMIHLTASVVQDSGEDWNGVAITFASSTPLSRVERPLLIHLWVRSAMTDSVTSVDSSEIDSYGIDWMSEQDPNDDVQLNIDASHQQIREFNQPGEVQRKSASDAFTGRENMLYEVKDKISLSSDTQTQTVHVMKTVMQGVMYRTVTPLLSSYAFYEAKVTNESEQSLIPGEADIYFQNRLIGKMEVPPVALGASFRVGLGPDRQVRTRRELLSRSQSIKGGNRQVDLVYRLVVANYHDREIEIRLLDRVPIVAKDKAIAVVLGGQSESQLSKDPLYLRMQRPTGILRWDLRVPANRMGSNAQDHEYRYSIELDRKQAIVGNDLVQRIQKELRFRNTNSGFGGGGMGVSGTGQ